MRYGDSDRARELFEMEAEKCVPPLDSSELAAIWRSGLKFLEKVKNQPGYIPPEEFGSSYRAGYLKPEDYSDIGQAKVLVRFYHEELLYTDATDYLRYNGSYWSESRQAAML